MSNSEQLLEFSRPVKTRRHLPILAYSSANIVGLFSGLILLALVFCALAAPLIAQPPNHQTAEILSGFSSEHWLGTDHLGRDMLGRIIWGSRATLLVSFLAVSTALVLGALVGIVSGYWGGLADLLAQRVVDSIIAFPGLIIAMALIAVFQASVLTISITIGILLSPGIARLARGSTMATASLDYIQAANVTGASQSRIILRHIIPNVTAPLIVAATVAFGQAVLIESSLSFLGFGLPPPNPTWGQMLSGPGRLYMLSEPWMAVIPGVAITVTILAANLFGDTLRDILDPRTR